MTHNQHHALSECVMSRKSEEILYANTKSSRLAPTITLKSSWRKDLDPRAPEGTVRPILPPPLESSSEQPSRLHSTVRPVALKSRAELGQQIVEVVQKDDEEIAQEGPGRPVVDFRIQGLLHSEMTEPEQNRVLELIALIESHPHQGGSTRGFEANKRVQPVQRKFEGVDSRNR